MSSLYFDNNPKQEVKLKKAEILLYYGKSAAGYYRAIGFPGITDMTSPSAIVTNNIVIKDISSNFYPISMTIWGKQYVSNPSNTINKFRMVELNDNANNRTDFEVQANNKISLSIGTGKSFTIDKLGVNDTIQYLQKATNTSPFLIGKIIIIYDDQNVQSMIRSTETQEMYKYRESYIGIM